MVDTPQVFGTGIIKACSACITPYKCVQTGCHQVRTTTEVPDFWIPQFDFITGNYNPPYDGWQPHCLKCTTMERMIPTDYGWKCTPCGNSIGRDLRHWNGPESAI